jgi:hypothetical protein
MARHGTRRCYVNGCRCDDSTASNRIYFRQRRASQMVADPPPSDPGPVESGVSAEIAGVTEARPGLAQVALAMAKIMDNPKALNQQPAARRRCSPGCSTSWLRRQQAVGAAGCR